MSCDYVSQEVGSSICYGCKGKITAEFHGSVSEPLTQPVELMSTQRKSHLARSEKEE